jgi:hypothetical protein
MGDTTDGSGSGTDGDDPMDRDIDSIDAEDIAELPGPKRQDADDLEIGEVFELLKNERRRRVIEYLKDEDDGETTLDVLAEHIAALENDIDVRQLSSSQRKRVYIALYQCHLPKMDNFGVIDYDKDRGTVALRNTALLDPYLASSEGEEAAETDAESDRTELGMALSVAAVAAVGSTGVGALAAVPPAGWTLLCVAALLWIAAT